MAADSDGFDAKLRQKSVLVELSQLRPSSLEGGLHEILAAVGRTLDVERASFWSLDANGAAIRCVRLVTLPSGGSSRGIVLEREKYPAYFAAMLTCEAIVATDARVDARTKEFTVGYFDVFGIGAMLDVPVWQEGVLAGVLCCEHVGGPRAWTNDEEGFARSAANIIALNLAATGRARAEERYRLISRATGDVVREWDLADDRIEWGDRLESGFGHPVTAETSTGNWWLEQIHPADRPRVADTVTATTREHATTWLAEYRFRRADGSWSFIVDRAFVTYGDDGRALRLTGAMQDVTSRKALEERLLVADRLASLGTLAAGIAHEINNPLSFVKGNVEHLESLLERHAGIPPEVFEVLEDAKMGTERIRRIVRDLGIFTRGNSDDAIPVDVDRVVASSLAIADGELRNRAIVLRDLGRPPAIRGSDAKLGQVIVNLVVNAAHAVKVKHAPAQARIAVRTRTSTTGSVVIEVTDNGCGIPPEHVPRLFDPFFTTKPVGEGTGLGLSISHSIVTSLGGTIEVDSAPGEGTTFRVTIPATNVETDVGAVPTRSRILVVDDEPAVRNLLQRILSKDFDVTTADGGRCALSKASAGDFDVVLCDIAMPGLSGVDLHAELVRAQSPLAEHFVFMTGGTLTGDAHEAAARVRWPVVEKPFSAADVRRIVSEVAAT